MRTTLNIDAGLIAEAQRLTGTTERTALIHMGEDLLRRVRFVSRFYGGARRRFCCASVLLAEW